MKTTVTVSHCHTLHSPINKQKSPKILRKSLYRNIIFVRFLKIFVFIQRPSKYHPTAFKVSSVEGQSIIRSNTGYHTLNSIPQSCSNKPKISARQNLSEGMAGGAVIE